MIGDVIVTTAVTVAIVVAHGPIWLLLAERSSLTELQPHRRGLPVGEWFRRPTGVLADDLDPAADHRRVH
ncbi:MAG: hypothetical protein ACRDTA_22405 [Pseudonocardiaceae bacterium]